MSYLDAFAQEAVDGITVAPEIDLLTSLIDGKVGVEISYQLKAKHKPEYWSAVGLPDGWEIDPDTGLITGSTDNAGLYKAIVTVSNFQKMVFTYSSNRVIIGSRALVTGEIVGVHTTGTLPSPLNASTLYEVYAPDTLIGGGANTDSVYLAPVGTSNYITLSGGAGSYYLVKRRIDEAALIIPILGQAISSVSDDSFTLLMDVDIDSGTITFPTISVGSWSPAAEEQRTDGLKAPKLAVKRGDRFPVAIGFKRANQLQDLPIGSVLIGSKQYTPEPLIPLTDSTFTKIGSGRATRYEVVLSVAEAAWLGVLSSEEEDEGTYVNSLCEVQYSTGGAATWAAVNQIIVHDTQELNLGQAIAVNQLFEFDELPDNADAPIDFQLSLTLNAMGNGVSASTSIIKPLTGTLVGGEWTFVDRDQDGLANVTTTTTAYQGALQFQAVRHNFRAIPLGPPGTADIWQNYSLNAGATPGREAVRFYNSSDVLIKTVYIGENDLAGGVSIPWTHNAPQNSVVHTGSYTITETKTITMLVGATTSTVTLTSGMTASQIVLAFNAAGDARIRYPRVGFYNTFLVLNFAPAAGARPSPFKATVSAVDYNIAYVETPYLWWQSMSDAFNTILGGLFGLSDGSTPGLNATVKSLSSGGNALSILTGEGADGIGTLNAFAQTVAYLKNEANTIFTFTKTPRTTTVITPFTPLNMSSNTILVGGWRATLRYNGIETISATEANVRSTVTALTLIPVVYGEPVMGSAQVTATLNAPGKEAVGGYTKTSETFVLRVEDDLIEN